jgi:hypothetical protein
MASQRVFCLICNETIAISDVDCLSAPYYRTKVHGRCFDKRPLDENFDANFFGIMDSFLEALPDGPDKDQVETQARRIIAETPNSLQPIGYARGGIKKMRVKISDMKENFSMMGNVRLAASADEAIAALTALLQTYLPERKETKIPQNIAAL